MEENKNEHYDASDIQVLEGLEGIAPFSMGNC